MLCTIEPHFYSPLDYLDGSNKFSVMSLICHNQWCCLEMHIQFAITLHSWCYILWTVNGQTYYHYSYRPSIYWKSILLLCLNRTHVIFFHFRCQSYHRRQRYHRQSQNMEDSVGRILGHILPRIGWYSQYNRRMENRICTHHGTDCVDIRLSGCHISAGNSFSVSVFKIAGDFEEFGEIAGL